MWPRPGDAVKNRHTGFVCFLRRGDAEAALHSLDDTDPFACGRRITLRWGKHIIRDESHESVLDIPTSVLQVHGRQISERPMIHVHWPSDEKRERWISTVADFVARDGSAFETVLMSREADNPRFDFLFPHGRDHAYYKWKVFSFCQGDHRGVRKAPFSMLEGGCLWVPPLPPPAPPSAENAARAESSSRKVDRDGRRRADGRARLDATELGQAHQLFRIELCASRQSICRAMAFCFEKTAAAHHVASLLQGLFMTEEAASHVTEPSQPPKVSVETLVSRLYLLSDVLFNSQQPSIKHAFLYRSAIEAMAPAVFSALGSYSRSQQARGRRWTAHHKLATSVHVVLHAWTAWNVYPPAFLQELQARFEGREATIEAHHEDRAVEDGHEPVSEIRDVQAELRDGETEEPCILEGAQGQWSAVEDTHESPPVNPIAEPTSLCRPTDREGVLWKQDRSLGGDDDDDDERRCDLDGEPVDVNDAATHSLEDQAGQPPKEMDPDREELDLDDPDGEPLDDDDPDGEPLVEADDPDGEPIDDADGEPIGLV
jgi:U2-associated protein SR140